MKIIYNNLLPFRGFTAMNFFGIIFVRKEHKGKLNSKTLNHELIHTAQMKELLYVFFYLWYVIEWIVRLFLPGNAYRQIIFERETYQNEGNPDYLSRRKFFSFLPLYWEE